MADINLDQHFLTDGSVIRDIIRLAELKENDVVLEVGPGKGAITRLLAKKAKVIAIEKDEGFMDALSKLETKNPGLTVIFGDFLKVKLPEFTKVVSSLPYSISAEFFGKLAGAGFELGVVVVGERFSKILSGGNGPNKLAYVFPLMYCIVETKPVPSSAFTPSPKKSSMVVKFRPRNKCELSAGDYLARETYEQSDKVLKNALAEAIVRYRKLHGGDASKRAAKQTVSSAGSNEKILSKKVQNLTYDEFAGVIKAISEIL